MQSYGTGLDNFIKNGSDSPDASNQAIGFQSNYSTQGFLEQRGMRGNESRKNI